MPLGAPGSTYAAATIPETMRTLSASAYPNAVDISTNISSDSRVDSKHR